MVLRRPRSRFNSSWGRTNFAENFNMQIKILSFNIWDIPFWFSVKREERARRLGEYLKRIDPHIICLQEAFDVRHRDDLHKCLGKEKYHITLGNSGTRRVLLFKRFDLTGGLVTFSKLPILKSSFVPFRRFVDMMFAEYIGRKGVLETIVKTPHGPLMVLNTHLHKGKTIVDRGIRLRQLKQVFKAAKKDLKSMPAVVVGDLNENEIMANKECAALIKKFGFRDSALVTNNRQPTVRPENTYAQTWFHRTTRPLRIDYALLNDVGKFGFSLKTCEVLSQPNSPISDHDPLLVTLEIKT